ncbi:MAG: hypothetical protein WC358_03625 [Ignavibacteria bacterium]|jgi:hypothetical protein
MKKVIFLVLLVKFSVIFAQNKTGESNFFLVNNQIKLKNILNQPDSINRSVSIGLGISTVNPDASSIRGVISLGLSHQIYKSLFLEGKFDYLNRIEGAKQIYLISLIPQLSFSTNNKVLKIYTGLGLGVGAKSSEGVYILPVVDTKFEYIINKWFSAYPEVRFPPLLMTLNFKLKNY